LETKSETLLFNIWCTRIFSAFS